MCKQSLNKRTHAKARRRKANESKIFAPSRLCVRISCCDFLADNCFHINAMVAPTENDHFLTLPTRQICPDSGGNVTTP